MIEIKEVANKKELKKFVNFPNKLYKGNEYYVPFLFSDELNSLHKKKNPAFDYCEAKYWLAYKDGKMVGRIAAIINYRYIDKWEENSGRFGYLDFVEDFEVAKKLFETAENWLKSKGMEKVQGPLGFCDMDPEGMLVEGFEEVGTMTTIYNHPYYPEYLERLGYKKEADWFEYKLIIPEKIPEKIHQMAKRAIEMNNLTMLKVKSSKEYLPYAKQIFHLLNDAYKDLYCVVPLSDKQVELYTKQYIGFLNKDSIGILLDENDKVAAFGIGIPSLSKALRKSKGKLLPLGFFNILKAMKINDTMELVLIAVRKDLQAKGVNAILLEEVVKICNQNGIKYADLNPQLESNIKVRSQWKFFPKCIQNKKRRSYKKVL